MKKVFLIILLIFFTPFSFLYASIDKKIVKNTKILKQKSKKVHIIKDKLEDIAKSIIDKKNEIAKIDQQIEQTNKYLTEQKKQYNIKMKELNELQNSIKTLSKTKDDIREKIIKIISKELSLEIIHGSSGEEDKNGIISKEAACSLSKVLKNKFDNIKDRYIDISDKIDTVTNKIKELKKYIDDIKKRKELLASIKKKRVKSIKYLNYQKISYDKKLNRIFSEQNAIKRTLRKLNILKQQIAIKNQQKTISVPNINNQKVRKIGTAYQVPRLIKYRGSKTIAPLRNFYIKRKFGSYYDPRYNIKIFNESVVLGSKIPNAKVRNVLNGKVVFAKSTPMLDNVVIVENARGIHTIYAHLSKIAPTIKKGKRIKKGYIIGRIKKELTFEVTQKNKHINPMRLIRF